MGKRNKFFCENQNLISAIKQRNKLIVSMLQF